MYDGLLGLLLTGCFGGHGHGGDGDSGAATDGMITLTSPTEGEKSYGDFTLTWEVKDFKLGKDGHVEVLQDGVSMVQTDGSAYTLIDLDHGDHKVGVRLVDTDGNPLDAEDMVDVGVIQPSISVRAPTTAPTGSFVSLPVTVTDFTLDESFTGTPVFGTGHYNINVDGARWDWGADPALAGVGRLTGGTHTISLELVGNDGVPLDPPIVSEDITLDVPATGPYVAFDHAPYQDTWGSADVPLSLTTANFPLDPSGPTGSGGRYHIYVDGVYLEANTVTSKELNHVAGGWHRYDVVLVDGSSDWELPVKDTLRVHVDEDRPDIKITNPGNNFGVKSSFTLSVAPENFTMAADKLGGVNTPGEGHYQILVDGVATTETAAATTTVSGLSSGTHTVRVQLMNNDGTPLDPVGYDEISVNVTGP